MARFFGTFEHSLDSKGRVILPARFRPSFDGGGFLSQHTDRCLALWTPPEFERQMEAMQAAAELNRTERNKARVWASGTHEVEIDRSGRMPIPANLRHFARLGSAAPTGAEEDPPGNGAPVLVKGAIDRVELWNPAIWERRVAPAEQLLTADDEEETEDDD